MSKLIRIPKIRQMFVTTTDSVKTFLYGTKVQPKVPQNKPPFGKIDPKTGVFSASLNDLEAAIEAGYDWKTNYVNKTITAVDRRIKEVMVSERIKQNKGFMAQEEMDLFNSRTVAVDVAELLGQPSLYERAVEVVAKEAEDLV